MDDFLCALEQILPANRQRINIAKKRTKSREDHYAPAKVKESVILDLPWR